MILNDNAQGVTDHSLSFISVHANSLVFTKFIVAVDLPKGPSYFIAISSKGSYQFTGFRLGYYGTGPTGFWRFLDCFFDLEKFEQHHGFNYKDTVGKHSVIILDLYNNNLILDVVGDGSLEIYDIEEYLREKTETRNRLISLVPDYMRKQYKKRMIGDE